MSFDWAEYLILARQLQRSGEEAKLRTAISRAYYAAFCKARNYVRDVDRDTDVPKDGRAHSYVKNKFIQSRYGVRTGIGADLNRLRIRRGKADYQDRVAGLPSMAKSAVCLANKVLSDLARI